ncbi:MAG: hypothetical protein HDKAJFGB_00030 [Anaerolineae bacterium]|nr:hypothetical protein [Anaerolineae bacterium]
MTRVQAELPEAVLDCLRAGAPVLVLTVGADGFPNAAFTYALALDAQRVRFCIDDQSSTFINLRGDARVGVQIMAPNNFVYILKGIARQVKARLEAKPTAAAVFELQTLAVKDQAWRGVTVAPLAYEWDAAQRGRMQAMEQAVYAEMRDAGDGIGEHGSLYRAAW